MTIIIKHIESEQEWQQMKTLLAELLTFEKSLRPERKQLSTQADGAFRYVRENIATHDGVALLALTEKGEAIGFLNGWIDGGDGLDEDNRVGMVSDFYIKEGYRNLWTAKKFYQQAGDYFRSKGLRRLSAETLGTNIRMQKLFALAGFTVHKIIFEKDLSRRVETASEC